MVMILLSALNTQLLNLVLVASVIILVGSILKFFKQPYIIAYILTGVLLGRHGFEVITDIEIITVTGEIGLLLLMFFIGMEICLPSIIKNWKVPIFGTFFQIIASISMVGVIGWFFGWSLSSIIVLGFITSLSSSAIVIKLLQDNDESQSNIGQSVISILLMQDILIVPMVILISFLGGSIPSTNEIILQLLGGILLVGVMVWIVRKKEFTLPIGKRLKEDHEMQVFVGIFFCFGFAVITSFLGISAALGAFASGMVVHAARFTDWFHDSLHSFRVVFVAVFFISVGMMIDVSFLLEHWLIILVIIIPVYVGNHFINAVVIHYFGRDWRESLYGGALLAQIGELSFVLVSTAFYSSIISDFEYQLTIIVISLTLLISPFWISGTRYFINK